MEPDAARAARYPGFLDNDPNRDLYHRHEVLVDKVHQDVSPTVEQRLQATETSDGTGRPPRRVKRRRRRRFGLIAALVILALLLAGAGGSYIAYKSLKSQADQLQAALTGHLELGETELEAAKTQLAAAKLNADPKAAQAAHAHFVTAKLQFTLAMQVADTSQTLRQAEALPVVGQLATSRHRAVDGVAKMGADVSAAGEDLADLETQLLAGSGGGQATHGLLDTLGQVNTKLTAVRREFVDAQTASAQVDISVIPSSQQAPFMKARATISLALGAIDEFQKLVPAVTEILGGNGARNYLVEQVNPAELRPGGGFIGTYSVIRADHGTLSLVVSGDAFQLSAKRASLGQPGYIAPPGPIREFVPTTGWSFIDSNFFADFSINATEAETFSQSHFPYHIDGVFAIDYYAVARMLQFTGPLPIPGYGLTVNSDNLVPLIIQYDYASYTDPRADAIHKALLAALAGSVFQRLTALPTAQWLGLVSALNDLAGSRHVQAYFNNSDVMKLVGGFGWNGALQVARDSDFMAEFEANLGGTKANYYVVRNYSVELSRNGGTLHHKVTVDITDNAPYAYRPNEFYRAYVEMYVSGSAANLSDNLVPPRYPDPPPPAGTKMIGGWMNIHGYGHDKVVVFQWDTPWKGNGRDVEQIYWQKQPGTQADKVDVVWNDGNGHTYKVSGDLAQDRVITLAPNGVSLLQGQIGTAQLPSLSLG